MKIRWNTDVNAPCAGEILQVYRNGKPTGCSVLIQTDYDYPSVAVTFGWSLADIQHEGAKCDHSGTDGTIPCPDCGMQPHAFIGAAYTWLAEHNGATADDPGYFSS